MKAASAVNNTSARSSGERETKKDVLSISWEFVGSAGIDPPTWSRLAWSKISWRMDSGRFVKVS